MFDRLPDDLRSALAAAEARLGPFAAVRYVPEIGSTNDAALALSAAGAPEGTSVLADLQTAGRGRRGRTWCSPPGAGLYLSVIVETGALLSSLSLVTIAAGVAVGEAVGATTGLPIELKWPNDLVIGRPWRKLGGILCESAGAGSRLDAVVVGLGVNLRPAAYPPEVAGVATSTESELGRPIDRAPLVVEVLARLRDVLAVLRAHGAPEICRRWRALGHAGLGGAPVRWRDADRVSHGFARDIGDDGALLVERAQRQDGPSRADAGADVARLVAGEVTWERLSRG
jgi:BirA family biotin operon repressor/biotin-[acetyl-CoA-carboxylase] ligase